MQKTSVPIIAVIIWICFLRISAAPSYAFFPPRVDASQDPELSGSFGQIIGPHWFKRKTTILTGKDGLGKEKLDVIYQSQLDRGIRNIPLLSLLLVRESLRALDRKDLDRAEFLCQYGKRFAPDYPSAYFTMGQVYWGRNKTLVTLAAREYVKGAITTFKNFRVLFFKSLNAIYLISGAVTLTFVVFALFMAFKYLGLYIHNVKKDFDLSPLRFSISLLKIAAFVVPVILHLNLLWSLVYWTILLWGYLARKEKHVIVVFLFLLVYLPWSLDEATDFLDNPDPMILMSLQQANEASWGNGTKSSLKKWGQENPEDADVLFTLGLLNKREGKYDTAERYYKRALQYDPNWPELISNLGNVYLSTHRSEEAVTHYERAISLSPRKASFYYNLHRASVRDSILSSEGAGQALDMAQKLDPRLVAFYTQINSKNKNRSIIDDTIGVGRLWSRTFKFFAARYGFPEGILRAWTRKVPGKYDVIYPILFLAFLLIFALVCSKRSFPKRCPLCGTPSVKFYARRIEGDSVCFGCNRLFVKKESIDPKMRDKRMRQVRRYEKRKAKIQGVLTLIIPGGGHLLKDQAFKGTFFVFVLFLLGLKFFHWNGIVQDPIALGYHIGFWSRFGFVVFFVLYYLGVLRSAIRLEG
jgi:tetratricopeptide (TPR) repeat protein